VRALATGRGVRAREARPRFRGSDSRHRQAGSALCRWCHRRRHDLWPLLGSDGSERSASTAAHPPGAHYSRPDHRRRWHRGPSDRRPGPGAALCLSVWRRIPIPARTVADRGYRRPRRAAAGATHPGHIGSGPPRRYRPRRHRLAGPRGIEPHLGRLPESAPRHCCAARALWGTCAGSTSTPTGMCWISI